MKFDKTLSIMLEISRTKIVELAQVLSYDRSYISRWANDLELPPEGTWEAVRGQMVEFFASNFSLLDMALLQARIPFYPTADQDKRVIIEKILEKAYRRSHQEKQMMAFSFDESMVHMITGQENVTQAIMNMLTSAPYKELKDRHFHYSSDMTDLFSDEILDTITPNTIYPNEISVKFTMGLDETAGEKVAIQRINRYFRLLTLLAFSTFEIYRPGPEDQDIVSLVQDEMLSAWGFCLEDGIPSVLFLSHHLPLVRKSGAYQASHFSKKTPVFTLGSDYVRTIGSLDQSSTQSPPFLYMPRLFLYLASDELCQSLYEEGVINQRECIVWRRVISALSRPEIAYTHLIIPRSGLMDTLKNHWIYKADGALRLYGNHYQKYIQDLENYFDKNRIIVIDDSQLINGHRLPELAVYGDRTNAFCFRFNRLSPYDPSRFFFQSQDADFTCAVHDWLQAVSKIGEENFLI